jgi:CRISPR-associated protein Cmr6
VRYLADPTLFLSDLDDLRQSIHARGALTFWDVFPKPAKGALTVEIMTPHYTEYYQNGGTPNDAGQPTPIPFLAVPAESAFDFHVVCEPHYLPDALRPTWKALLRGVFTHAFDWMGFGAKTAVGYGIMQRDPVAEEAQRQREAQKAERRAQEAAERHRQAVEAAEVARKRAEFEAMPESNKALDRFQQALAVFGAAGQLDKDRYAELAGLLNRLASEAHGWTVAADRAQAADAMVAACERFGWAPPGLKRDKREKQEGKRREQIEKVRAGGM